MLSKVVRECRKCLLKNLNTDNVIHFLEQSLRFGHPELERDCLKLIYLNSKAVFAGAKILSASREVLKLILESPVLPVNESVICETAIKWAKCQLQGVAPTDLKIRETLGDLLYCIHFPIMKPSEFAEISVENELLTAEEKESIYYFLSTKKKIRQLKFSTKRRIGRERWVDRTESDSSVDCWDPSSDRYLGENNFKTDQDILLTGIGLYRARCTSGYNIDVEILQMDSSLFKKSGHVPSSEDSGPLKVELDDPIVILAKVLYSVKTKCYDHIHNTRELCKSVCTKGNIKFTFVDNQTEAPSTYERGGQIPRLYFCRF